MGIDIEEYRRLVREENARELAQVTKSTIDAAIAYAVADYDLALEWLQMLETKEKELA